MLHGDTNVNAGVVVAFTSYMSLFSGPITQIAVIIQQLAQVSSNLEQVFDTIDYPVDIRDKKDSIVLQNVKGQVDFDNIDFAYEEGVNILENFNLHVKPGETIALVGPTGAGKTTITNLINRFYDIADGKIRYDGININKINKPCFLSVIRSNRYQEKCIALQHNTIRFFCGRNRSSAFFIVFNKDIIKIIIQGTPQQKC